MDLKFPATKLNAKWVMRATNSQDFLTLFLKKVFQKFKVEKYPTWASISLREKDLSKVFSKPYGLHTIRGLGHSWNFYRKNWKEAFKGHKYS